MLTPCGGSSSDDTAEPSQTPAPGPATNQARPAATSTNPSPQSKAIEIGFADGQVQGGRRTERVEVGEQVRIRAVSDVAEELHVHTYDRRVELRPSEPADVVFTADIPGRHEVEFERSGRQALTLEVG